MSPHVKIDADARRPSKPAYAGVLRSNGAWLRNPRGGVEDVAEMAAAGRRWLGLNMHEPDWTPKPASWEYAVRPRALRLGLTVFPWLRVYDRSDVRALRDVAERWSEQAGRALPVAPNLEVEAHDRLPPAAVCEELDGYEGEVITFTVAFLYRAVDWQPLAERGAVVLEIFPAESEDSTRVAGCVARAHEAGFRDVFLCYGAYAGQTPDLYDLALPHSVYTGDDVGAGNWRRWSTT